MNSHVNQVNFSLSFNKNNIILILLVSFLIVIEIAVIASITKYIQSDSDNTIINFINNTNNRVISYFDLKIDEVIFIIKRNAAFFRIHGIYMSSDNYTDFLQSVYLPSRKNIQSYMWIPKISYNNVENFEVFCKKYVSLNYTIKQIKQNFTDNSSSIFEKVSERDYYYPITLIEPVFPEPQQSLLLGLDLNIFNKVYNIIKIANSSSNATATFRIDIAQNIKQNPYNYNFLLNYPCFIYSNSTDTSKILGYSSALIHIGNILDEATRNIDLDINRNDIDFFAFDLTTDGFTNVKDNNVSLLYKENKMEYTDIWSIEDINANKYLFTYNYNIGLRKWVFLMKYSDNYIHKSRNNLLIIFPCIMPIIFFLLDLVIIIFYKYMVSLKEKIILEEKKANISTQMLGYVNHEIRNPLNVIKGLVCFILQNMIKMNNENLEKKIKIDKITFDTIISDLSTVVGSCDMLEHIVTDILDIQKLDSGRLELDNKWVKIDYFMRDIHKTISQKIDEKQTITFKKIYDPDLMLFFDTYRMKQILLNFLTNSIKYTTDGEIILIIEENMDSFRFSVRDTGRGIHEEAKSKIFQPFNQTSPEDASRYGGIGLGLYLCKMLTGIMNGTIGFESTFGHGSIFWVEFAKCTIRPECAEKITSIKKIVCDNDNV